jgi:hypothetical protein
MKEQERQMTARIEKSFQNVLEQIGGVDQKLHSLPEDMCHILQSRFVIDGAVQLTRADVVSLFDDFRASHFFSC